MEPRRRLKSWSVPAPWRNRASPSFIWKSASPISTRPETSWKPPWARCTWVTTLGPSAGLPDLREAIAEEVTKSRGVKFTADEVVVVPGGKPIIFFTMLALVEEGDEVIYPNPGFPIYESMINFLGEKAVPIPLREERDFRIDVDELASLITDRTRLIILNSPQNPTGGVLTKNDIFDIAGAVPTTTSWS